MDFEEDTGPSGFSWENQYTQSWEILREDADGTLQTSINELRRSQYLQRRRMIADKALRRGILRHLFVALDMSTAANETDYAPSRGKVVLAHLRDFSKAFFEQNPLSQLGVVGMRDGLAEKICGLSGNYKEVLEKLAQDSEGKGEASIQNVLEVVKSMLMHVPSHGTKEVLILFAGVASCDAGDIHSTIETLKRLKIRVSAISISGEIFVLKTICQATNGQLHVALHDEHYKELLASFVSPPTTSSSEVSVLSYLVPMGFPQRASVDEAGVFCACHGSAGTGTGYRCPKCQSHVCQVPMDCPVCGLTLITAPYLARSYHHLYPVSHYEPVAEPDARCTACSRTCLEASTAAQAKVGGNAVQCARCHKVFCADCDLFVHETLFSCPGCLES